MSSPSHSESGFSAVELLITLFIAAAFIGTGYQLYSIIIKDGGEARMRTRANNVAYTALRRYSPQATKPCSVISPTPTPTIATSENLPASTIAITFSCPYGTSSNTSRVEVSLKYGTPQEEVAHALYVSK